RAAPCVPARLARRPRRRPAHRAGVGRAGVELRVRAAGIEGGRPEDLGVSVGWAKAASIFVWRSYAGSAVPTRSAIAIRVGTAEHLTRRVADILAAFVH